MIKRILSTNERSIELLVARVTLGLVILPHGMQKVFGLFGGMGFSGTINTFDQYFGMPAMLTILVILAEFVGALGLVLGFLSRFMGLSVLLTMIGAMVLGGHLQNGFFMNWFGNQAGEGMEYFFLTFGLALVSIIGGSGRFSVDSLLVTKLKM